MLRAMSLRLNGTYDEKQVQESFEEIRRFYTVRAAWCKWKAFFTANQNFHQDILLQLKIFCNLSTYY